MGQVWSTLSRGLIVYYETRPLGWVAPPCGPHGPQDDGLFHIYISGVYGTGPTFGSVKNFCFIRSDPESLLREMLRFDIVGLIVDRNLLSKTKGKELYIYGEDEIDTSITLNPPKTNGYTAVYPEKYAGLVPYYIGCERLRALPFSRPKRFDPDTQEAFRRELYDKKRL
ncbi:hypothetical protein TWF481_007613 [Arthrobotrys musiformis]|uniref:Uncharacterized protein n=1 Tax=Arthrobotrys musiformis TaxID=47236 RepID=A0AAV9WDT7_9PEZI